MPRAVFFDSIPLTLALYAALCACAALASYLPFQVLQLSGYKNKNFLRQIQRADKFYAPLTLASGLIPVCVLAVLYQRGVPSSGEISLGVSGALALFTAARDFKRKKKTPLVFTARIKRAYAGYFAAALLACMALGQVCVLLPALCAPIAFAAVNLLKPVELCIARSYTSRAARSLKSQENLIRIGITGSFGKTSVKNILAAMLAKKYNVLSTPASYNTPLGIARSVLSSLQPGTEVFIAEMGARRKGDIAKLCAIVRPQWGIITSVAHQHIQTFKTVHTVAKTKFELYDFLKRNDGTCVLNIGSTHIEKHLKGREYSGCIAVSLDGGGGVYASDISAGSHGLSFTLDFGGETAKCRTHLLGRHSLTNILLSACLAYKLGVSAQCIVRAAEELEPVPHRLQLITAGGLNIIDDSYNASPDGSAAALEVLSQFPGNKIIVTPGLVELGHMENRQNQLLGERIAKVCDYAVLVGARATFMRVGAISCGMSAEKIFTVQSLSEAQSVLSKIARPGDTVLFENDLPDNL